MKRSYFAVLLALAACDSGPSHRDVGDLGRTLTYDDGFEANDFSEWEVIGNATVVDASFGTAPASGDYQALLSTDDAESLELLADFMNILPEDLTAIEPATEGSGARRELLVEEGDILQFDWNFLTDETDWDSDPATFNDFVFVVQGVPFAIADTGAQLTTSNTPFATETGYHTFSHRFTADGVFDLGIGVVDAVDTIYDSAVLLDNVRVIGKTVLDFETDSAGNELAAGTLIGEQWATDGVHIACLNNHYSRPDACLTFDSSNPTADISLGTPNIHFGGSGKGWAGQPGEVGANDTALENLLVIAHNLDDNDDDGLVDWVRDDWKGGQIILTFDTPSDVSDITLVDIYKTEERGATVYAETAEGTVVVDAALLGSNSVQTLDLALTHVTQLTVDLRSEGAFAGLTFRPSCIPGDC